ncbi:MAG: gfo/Idh/MocA family oxidoreductase [Gemmataceae bacterium]
MANWTRREFLRDGVLLPAAAAVLADVPVYGTERTVAARKVGANDRIHVAVIGFHGQGRAHLSGFARLADCEVTAICDVDSSLADMGMKIVEDAQKKRPKYYQDLRKLLEDKDVDVVTIATPNHWHALAAIWAIQAGKDVYVEKPVSHNVWEGRRIVDFARKYQKIVQTGTQSRSNEGMRELIDYILSGKIGTVYLARGLCYKRRPSIGPRTETPVPPGVDYNLWLGPAPEKPITRRRFHYDWHWFWDYGNGDLGNQGIHEMDKARWGLGQHALCRAVLSIGGRFGYEDAGETANTQVCWYDYGTQQLIFEVRGLPTDHPKDAPAAFHVKKQNWVGNIWYGTEGIAVSNSYAVGAVFTPQGELVRKFSGGGNHYQNFIKAVRSRRHTDLNADIEEGHLSSALCHLGNISYRLGKAQDPQAPVEGSTREMQETVQEMLRHLQDNGARVQGLFRVGPRLTFDPTRERFPNYEEANRLLTRDYRKPFVVPERA